MQDTPVVKLYRQHEILLSGTPPEKLEVLKELREIANGCRTCVEALTAAEFEDPTAREKNKPWREFQKITGEPIFNALMEIVRHDPPSEVRELTGDIMAQLWHPCAVGRLLEDYERRRDTVAHSPPLAIYRNLGGIGTEAAARALMWLWGGRWDADIAGALGMCDSSAAQDLLVRQAREHSNVHVRAMCMGNLKLPVTKEKADLFIDWLLNGEGDECFVAIFMINSLRVSCAAGALVSMRAKVTERMMVEFINKTLLVLKYAPDWQKGRAPAEL